MTISLVYHSVPFIFSLFFLLLSINISTVRGQYEDEALEISATRVVVRNYCAAYTECVSVSILEERLCLGNSIWRPFWLPQRNDPSNCHKKMRNDYENLEHLEEEADSQMNACLNENSVPLDKKLDYECKLIGRTPRFIIGRTITYVPNNCFAGTKRRIERQCSRLAKCCPPIEKCKLLTSESAVYKMINTTRDNLRKRAADCQKGLELAPSVLDGYQFSLDRERDHEQVWAPKGHVNVNFHTKPDHDPASASDTARIVDGHVNVRFSTLPAAADYQEEEENRAGKLLIRYGDRRATSGSPDLSYPKDKPAKESFDKKFKSALNNTNTYKKQIEKLNKEAIAREGFDSLIDAAAASKSVDFAAPPPVGTITISPSVDEKVVQQHVKDENSVVEEAVAVTSSPIIFVGNSLSENNGTSSNKPTCKEAASSKLANILALLGENRSSQDFKQIHELLKKFENESTRKNLTEKQKSKAMQVERALVDMFNRFENQGADNVPSNRTGIHREDDGLEFCDEPEVVAVGEETSNSTVLVDDNGDKFVIDKDTTTLFVGDAPPSDSKKSDSEIPADAKTKNFISEEYKKEIDEFRKSHHLWSMTKPNKNAAAASKRKETSCDVYMRCRNQMHMAVDSCAWRFASDELLATIAESAESLLYKSEKLCSLKDGEQLSMLFETVIGRNNKLRDCLYKKNKKVFEESVCLAYSEEKRIQYDLAIKRILNETYVYNKSRDCFSDANLIQEKCTILRDCCPNFDSCREEVFDVETERTLINLTASINDLKQECAKNRAKEAVKHAVRQLLLSSEDDKPIKIDAKTGIEISKGARVVRMARYAAV